MKAYVIREKQGKRRYLTVCLGSRTTIPEKAELYFSLREAKYDLANHGDYYEIVPVEVTVKEIKDES